MAKMFYTVEEVCELLGKTSDELREMVTSGQLQEFRDREKLMFKVDQIDLLRGEDDSDEVILDLDDTRGDPGLVMEDTGSASGFSLEDTAARGDSVLGLTSSQSGTGMPLTDVPSRDLSGETRVEEDVEEELSLESVGSGSGLLDLTRESDDTSLGAELLEEVYSSEEDLELPSGASGLFEPDAEVADFSPEAGATMPMMVEVYDGTGSGLGVGLGIAAMAALVVLMIIVVVSLTGSTPRLALLVAENLWAWTGGLAGIAIVCGLVGLFLGKASE